MPTEIKKKPRGRPRKEEEKKTSIANESVSEIKMSANQNES